METLIAAVIVGGLLILLFRSRRPAPPQVRPPMVTVGMTSDEFVEMCLDMPQTQKRQEPYIDPWPY